MERSFRRSYATGLRSLTFVVIGLGVAAACSDDGDSDSEVPGSGGGEAGESSGVTAGKGGSSSGGGGATANGGSEASAGTKADAGSASEGGAPATAGAGGSDTGDGGMAGSPMTMMPLLGAQCTTCGTNECAGVVAACGANADCKAWLTCVAACEDGACTDECDVAHGSPARVYAGIYDCLCTSCATACTGVDACGKKTCVDDHPLTVAPTAPATLAETGLYEFADQGMGGAGSTPSGDLAMPLAIASDVRTYDVSYPLWADGAVKQRYIYVPKCSTIDTSDMNHWKFPVGTRIWKTFAIAGKAIETRLMLRHGPSEADWLFAAYQWDENDSTNPAAAKLVENPAGLQNVNGTTHDIPSVMQCGICHNKLSERVLGFGALQLSHPATGKDVAIKEISQLGWLSAAAPNGFTVPGTAVQKAALGYLHGNCGGCHNQGQAIPNTSPLYLRLLVEQTDYAMTDTVKTTISKPMVSTKPELTGKERITPMDTANSGILIRMKARTPPDPAGLQMPSLGTEVADTDGGVKAVTDWIGSIPVPQN